MTSRVGLFPEHRSLLFDLQDSGSSGTLVSRDSEFILPLALQELISFAGEHFMHFLIHWLLRVHLFLHTASQTRCKSSAWGEYAIVPLGSLRFSIVTGEPVTFIFYPHAASTRANKSSNRRSYFLAVCLTWLRTYSLVIFSGGILRRSSNAFFNFWEYVISRLRKLRGSLRFNIVDFMYHLDGHFVESCPHLPHLAQIACRLILPSVPGVYISLFFITILSKIEGSLRSSPDLLCSCGFGDGHFDRRRRGLFCLFRGRFGLQIFRDLFGLQIFRDLFDVPLAQLVTCVFAIRVAIEGTKDAAQLLAGDIEFCGYVFRGHRFGCHVNSPVCIPLGAGG